MNNTPAQNGDMVKDLITGFTGIVTARTKWLHGCDRLLVQATTLDKNGLPPEGQTFDEQRLEVLVHQVLTPTQNAYEDIPLGSKVRDVITGFTGIAVARVAWFGGQVSYTVEPDSLNASGQTIESRCFEVDRVKLVESKPVPIAVNSTTARPGGPQRGENAATSFFSS